MRVMSLIHIVPFMVFPVAMGGCSTWYPKVPVVNLDQQQGRCSKGDLPYVFPHGQSAVCMDKKVVLFTTCVRELSLSTVSARMATESALKAAVPKAGEASVERKSAHSVDTEFSNDQVLLDARAEALRHCIRLSGGSPAAPRKP